MSTISNQPKRTHDHTSRAKAQAFELKEGDTSLVYAAARLVPGSRSQTARNVYTTVEPPEGEFKRSELLRETARRRSRT